MRAVGGDGVACSPAAALRAGAPAIIVGAADDPPPGPDATQPLRMVMPSITAKVIDSARIIVGSIL